MKILVVDDEKLLVKGIKFNLENEGYQVDACYDGEAAVEMARTGLRRDPAGSDDAEAGRAGSLSEDPAVFHRADHHAHGAQRGRGQAYWL